MTKVNDELYGCSNTDFGFSTKAIHAGQEPDPSNGALITPIFQTSTYAQQGLGKNKGYIYARSHNPTRTALEECLATLEGAKYGLAVASGMGAVSTVLNTLSAGDHVVVGEDVYGGVYRLFERVLKRFNIEFTYVDSYDLDAVNNAFKTNTKLIWIETPTNPLLKLCDIEAIAKIAHANKSLCVVDNTFASPYFQQPLKLGADIVIHSTTKYLGGHSDVIGGAIVTNSPELYEDLKFHENATGNVPGPFDCFLILRGVKTLSLRLDRHQQNAFALARLLESHPAVEKVYYPGLESHAQFDLAKKQMTGYGGIVSFVLKGGLDAVQTFIAQTKLFALAESLGGVRSLVAHPSTMTHAPIPRDVQEQIGIVQGLLRLSIGIEDTQDLVRDITTALDAVQAATGNGYAETAKAEKTQSQSDSKKTVVKV
jgi:cystathionine gamma-lyase